MKILVSILFVFLFFSTVKAQKWKEITNLLESYFDAGEYEKAVPIAEKAIEIAKNEFGVSHGNYAISLNKLALLYTKGGKYENAKLLYLQAQEIFKKTLNGFDSDYANSLDALGGLYVDLSQYGEAETQYIQAKVIREKIWGKGSIIYAVSLNNLALIYRYTDRYEKAEALYIQANLIFKNLLGEDHPAYATSLHNLAYLYTGMGQYEKAESFYIQAKEIRKRKLGEYHPDYATTLENLAGLYRSMGQYEKAEPLYIQAKEIQKQKLGEDHPHYARILGNSAGLYQAIGQYEKSESFYIQALDIFNNQGQNNHDFASTLGNLAGLYQNMGQYKKAESFFIQATEIWKKILGEDHTEYATSLNNLALLYSNMGQYEKAELLFIQSGKIWKKILGENHPRYATSLFNLALLYKDKKQYEKSDSLLIKASDIQKKVLGEDHPEYAKSLNGLAVSFERMGQYEKAKSMYIKVIAIDKKVFGEKHSSYARDLNNLALFYSDKGQYEEAEPLFLQNDLIILSNLLNNFSILSEEEKGNYIANKTWFLKVDNSFIYNYTKASSSFIRHTFNQQLIFKSLTLSDTRNVLTSIQQNPDTSVQGLLKDWQNSKRILARQYAMPVANRRADLKQVEIETEKQEKELNRKSSAFRNQQAAVHISLGDIQKKLKVDEAAIEFVSFRLLKKKWTDSTIYAAYILRKIDSVPVFIPLCEEKQLTKILSPQGVSNESIKALYRSDIAGEEEQKIELGDSLYALIWKPLLPYLQGIKRIDYSPAGLLHKVAFHALPAGDSQLLLDKYQLRQYTSLRQIAEETIQSDNVRSIAMFGDCSFTMDSTAIVRNNAYREKLLSVLPATISTRGGNSWNDLPGTAEEINVIRSLFDKNSIRTASYSKEAASEENLKSLSGQSAAILHLATHGFFLPDPQKKKGDGLLSDDRNVFTLADDPLLRSGIVLAGANRAWRGQTPIEGIEDGIVTAYEISQLDLRKTDLVVLSACETALGDIKGNEGVFGLQRAFKLAGVKNMLLSLWKVPDAETAELMTAFYKYYLGGRPAREALNSAQKELRKKYSPYYWAAFVLIE